MRHVTRHSSFKLKHSQYSRVLLNVPRSRSMEHAVSATVIQPTLEVSGSRESATPAPPPPPLPTTPYSYRSVRVIPPISMHYIRDYDEANQKVAQLQPGHYGFDLEWKPTHVKGQPENRVAIVQLANNQTILLIQVSAMRSFPENLKSLLESPDYIKAGAGIQYDSKKICADYGVEMKHCVDLSLLARCVDNARWKGKYTSPLGLARLIATYDNLLLGKGKITWSNWEAVLSGPQQEYASNDAHAGFALYSRFIAMAEAMETVPLAAYYSYDVVRGLFCDPFRGLWHPQNPKYDPGPPPPPRVVIAEQGKGKAENKVPPRGFAASRGGIVSSSFTSPSGVSPGQQTRRTYHSGDGGPSHRGRGGSGYRNTRPRLDESLASNPRTRKAFQES